MHRKNRALGFVIFIIVTMMPLFLIAEEPAKLEPLPFTIQAKDKRDVVVEKIQQPITSPSINENALTSVNSELSELKKSIEHIKQEHAKQNEIVGLKDQLAEMKGKAGDNKQSNYENGLSTINTWLAVYGLSFGIMAAYFGFMGLGRINEVEKDLKDILSQRFETEAIKQKYDDQKRFDEIEETLKSDYSELFDSVDKLKAVMTAEANGDEMVLKNLKSGSKSPDEKDI